MDRPGGGKGIRGRGVSPRCQRPKGPPTQRLPGRRHVRHRTTSKIRDESSASPARLGPSDDVRRTLHLSRQRAML